MKNIKIYTCVTLFFIIVNHSYSQSKGKTMKTKEETTTQKKVNSVEFTQYTNLTKSDSASLLQDFIKKLNGNWYVKDDLFGMLEMSIKLSEITYKGQTTFTIDSKPQPSLPATLAIVNGMIKIITTINNEEQDVADIKINNDALTIKNATNTTTFFRKSTR